MKVSDKIVDLREMHGLTQTELAEKLNINRSVLNRMEKGTRPIRDEELKLIADYFNVSTDSLLDHDNQKKITISSDDEIKLLLGYRMLDNTKRQILFSMLAFLSSPQSTIGNMNVQQNSGGQNFMSVGGQNNVNV